MAYDEELAHRVRAELSAGTDTAVSEKRMFGGLAFLLNGNMAVAVSGQGGLMVRVDPAEGPTLAEAPGVELMVMRGREMPGWLRVAVTEHTPDAELRSWVRRGAAFAHTLPAK